MNSSKSDSRKVEPSGILVLGGICALALGVRAAFLATWASGPLFGGLVGDELHFHRSAMALLEGQPAQGFLYQPLYTFFLAGAYAVLGPDVAAVRVLQLLLGTGNCLVFYALGRAAGGRLAGEHARPIGWMTALVAALYGPQVFFEAQLLAPVLTVPLVAGALACLLAGGRSRRSRRSRYLLACGLLLGLAMMGRPNLGVLLPVAAVWPVLGPGPIKRRLLAPVLICLGLVLGLSPSWLHNLARGQGLVAVSTSAGHSFYIGNNPSATGWFHVPASTRIDATGHDDYIRSLTAVAEEAADRPLSPAEVSSYWLDRGLSFWRDDPGRALVLAGKKLLLAVHAEEAAIHHAYCFGREMAPWLTVLLSFGVLFPFAVTGARLTFREHAAARVLASCAGAYLLTLVAFYVADRYRILLLPMLAPLAALGARGLYQRFRRGVRPATLALVVTGLVFGITQLPVLPDSYRPRAVAAAYNAMGTVAGNRGDLDAAARYFRAAIDRAPAHRSSQARANLGLVHEQRGRWDKARRLYLEAAAMAPRDPVPRLRLARLAERTGAWREAIRWWEEVAARTADPARARAAIQRLRERGEANEP